MVPLTGQLQIKIDSTSQSGVDVYNSFGYIGLLNGDTYTINTNYTYNDESGNNNNETFELVLYGETNELRTVSGVTGFSNNNAL